MKPKFLLALTLLLAVAMLFSSCSFIFGRRSGETPQGEEENDPADNPGSGDPQPDVTPVNTKPYTRVDANGRKSDNGEYLLFGSYPQSEETDRTIISALNEKSGSLPTASNAGKWNSCGYYDEGNVANYAWYIDLEYNGEQYRGVYFTKYRPSGTLYVAGTNGSNSYQIKNGYSVNTTYWFRYEPLMWHILSENNGQALLISESAIDCMQFYHGETNRKINTKSVYPNNYEHSDVRTWLNGTFFETAFGDSQKAIIETVTLNNSAKSTNRNDDPYYWNKGENNYICRDTTDQVFLLSEQDVTNGAYGFNPHPNSYDELCRKQSTDYAKSQGAYVYTGEEYANNIWWWLRSPSFNNGKRVRLVHYAGSTGNDCGVTDTSNGIVPALWIQL